MQRNLLNDKVFLIIKEHKRIATTVLVSQLTDRGYTVQGVYKSLRVLESKGKVIRTHGNVELDYLSIFKEIDALLALLPRRNDALSLYQKTKSEKVIVKVKSLHDLHVAYNQIFLQTFSTLESEIRSIFFANPYNFAHILFPDEASFYLSKFANRGLKVYLLSPINSFNVENKIKHKNVSEYSTAIPWRIPVTIIGDYIIIEHIHKDLLQILKELKKEDLHNKNVIERIISKKYNCKITVERNPTLARTYEKEFRKYFVIS